MLVKCDGFWSYVCGEGIETVGDIKHYLTQTDYDFQTKKNINTRFYLTHSKVLENEVIKFPTGLCNYILQKFNLEVEYKHNPDNYNYEKSEVLKVCNEIHNLNPSFEVRDYQVDAVLTSLTQYQSLIDASVGSGKTSIMATVVKILAKTSKILIINDNGLILNQIYERLLSVGISKDDISNDISDLSKQICVISSDMLHSRLVHGSDNNYIKQYLSELNVLICDECQHLQAISSFLPLLYVTPGVFHHIIGYSGSPFRNHKNPLSNATDKLTVGLLGMPAFTYDMKDAVGEESIAKPHSYFISYNGIKPNIDTDNYYVLYNRNIQNNWARNNSGIAMLEFLNQYKLKTLALFNHVERHALPILKKLAEKKVNALLIRGGAGVKKGIKQCVIYKYVVEDKKLVLKEETGSIDTMVEALKNDCNIILASSILNEGVDVSLFDAGVLFSGGKSPISLIQQVGRVSRKKSQGLNVSLIIDFKDTNCTGMFINQYNKRKQLLAQQGVQNFENVQNFIEFVKEVSYNKYHTDESKERETNM